MITIPLTMGYVAVIDDEDAYLAALKWQALERRWPDGSIRTVYARRNLPRAGGRGGLRESLHRAVMQPPPGMDVDHLDRDGLNCRRFNLRVATRTQNNGNRAAGAASGMKGVTWDKRKRLWGATIASGGRSRWLGYFDALEAAGRAYDAAARELFGKFARVNFPESAEQHAHVAALGPDAKGVTP